MARRVTRRLWPRTTPGISIATCGPSFARSKSARRWNCSPSTSVTMSALTTRTRLRSAGRRILARQWSPISWPAWVGIPSRRSGEKRRAMVKHLMMWRLRDFERGLGDLANKHLILDAIAAMRTGITGLRAVEIGINRRRAGDAADLALYTEFESWSALHAYEIHPLHEELKRLIGPLRVERRVVDYEVS